MTIAQEVLTKIVESEKPSVNHWLLNDIFYPSIKTKQNLHLMVQGEYDNVISRSVVYDWWDRFTAKHISHSYLLNAVQYDLTDETVDEFIVNIYEKFESYIIKHYNFHSI